MRALVLRRPESNPKGTVAALEDWDDEQIPGEADVLVRVAYSSLNYKDGLAVTGRGRIVRAPFPFVPGIDLAGTVVESASAAWEPGDAVVLTGWGTGEERWGGYAEFAWADEDHLVRLPDGLTPRSAMALGTGGVTAMLSVMALRDHGVKPDAGEVVVTGASGGVGSLAVALLARLGYDVVASTGSPASHDFLRSLGARRLLDRREIGEAPARPLGTALWAGAVDGVGGDTLANLLAHTDRHGCVAAYGLVAGHELHTTVMPFILRGVTLAGIDSNTCPTPRRKAAWDSLSRLLSRDLTEGGALAGLIDEIDLADVIAYSEKILAGDTQGRVVVRVGG
ncbi:MAG: MDR family oxidoreductase [Bacteroidota bacterium]